MRRLLLALAASTTMIGCEGNQPPPPGNGNPIGGLLQAQATFTTSPDRCAIAMLFDNYRLNLPAEARRVSPERTLTISGGGGRPFKAQVRGAFIAPEPIMGSINLEVAGKAEEKQVPRTPDEPFLLSFDGQLSPNGETRIQILASLKGELPAGETALLDVDSLDIAVGPGQSCK